MKLILLPGMDGTGRLFADFIGRLPANIEPVVVAYPEKALLGYAQLEEWVAQGLPTDSDYVILGESFSGPIAISLAARSPVGLKGVILCCTFARNPQPLLALFGRFLPVSWLPARLRNMMLLGGYGNDVSAAALNTVLQGIPDRVLAHRIRAVARQNVLDLPARIGVPVLAMRASRDRLIPRATADEMMAKVKRGSVVDIDGPHMLLQANPAASAEAVVTFIDGLKGSTRLGYEEVSLSSTRKAVSQLKKRKVDNPRNAR